MAVRIACAPVVAKAILHAGLRASSAGWIAAAGLWVAGLGGLANAEVVIAWAVGVAIGVVTAAGLAVIIRLTAQTLAVRIAAATGLLTQGIE